MSKAISRLTTALDADIPPQARKAIHDAIHQIKLRDQEIKELKRLLANMNEKHVAVHAAIRNCAKIMESAK